MSFSGPGRERLDMHTHHFISPSVRPATEARPAALHLPQTGFLRQQQVLTFIPISKSTLWRRVQEKTFPSPVKLSARVTAWRAEDIRRWIEAQSTAGSG